MKGIRAIPSLVGIPALPRMAIPLVALLAALSGCYPHSHNYVLTQEFSGVLLEDGTPMTGVSVSVSRTRGDTGDYCIEPEVVAVTSNTGAFHIPRQIQKQHFTSVLNPPQMVSQSMSICFEARGKRRLGAFVISPTDREVRYDAVCDWNSRGVEFKQNTILAPHQRGICTRSDQLEDGS